MKNLETLKTQIEGIIRDNKDFILTHNKLGNVYEYLIDDFAYQEQGHCFYLTDEEVIDWNNDEQRREELITEITDFLKKYDYNLGLTVENLVAIYKREDSQLETEFFRTQSRFDVYVQEYCKQRECFKNELTNDELLECASNFLEYDNY